MEYKEAPYDEALGKCKFCQANNVRSPKTDKIFCSEKCWLKKATGGDKQPYTPEQAKSQEIKGFQENKEESMRLMSSGRDATLMVTAMMGQGSAWTDEQLKDKIKEWQNYFYTKVYVDDPLRGK